MSIGRVYLVGAGPGDPALLTVRGRQVLQEADVVVYDALLPPRLLDFAPPHAERIYVGKRAADHAMSQDDINGLLVAKARSGKTVVRLKGGDPFVFGRGGEEALALADAAVPFEVVPGVTAAVAAAACAGIPITQRDLASAVGFVTGHEADDKDGSALDWDALARWKGTLAFYMGVANLATIAANLVAHGLAADTPAAVIHWGATPRQRVVTGTLKTLPEAAAAAGLEAPAIIVVGQVVTLRDRLNWFERRPLMGRRIVVTRSRAQASDLLLRLESLGAETIEAPTIRIEPPRDPRPLKEAAARLSSFDWVVFTSMNGVDAVFGALADAGRDARAFGRARVAAIGPVTAARLISFGIRADLQPGEFTGAAVAATLARQDALAGRRVLLPRADIAPPALAEALADAGAVVTEVVAYRTVPDASGAAAAVQHLDQRTVDWVTFTSSSTVTYFLEAVGPDRLTDSNALLASIGPTTSATLRQAGLEPAVEAAEHTTAGLVDAIVKYEAQVRPHKSQ